MAIPWYLELLLWYMVKIMEVPLYCTETWFKCSYFYVPTVLILYCNMFCCSCEWSSVHSTTNVWCSHWLCLFFCVTVAECRSLWKRWPVRPSPSRSSPATPSRMWRPRSRTRRVSMRGCWKQGFFKGLARMKAFKCPLGAESLVCVCIYIYIYTHTHVYI